jgi:UDPglucose 6-dehydrogenase
LIDEGATITIFDPEGMDNARLELPLASFSDDIWAAISGADCVVVATEWPEFAEVNLARVAKSLRQPVFVDLRNLFDHAAVEAAGIAYHGIGEGSAPLGFVVRLTEATEVAQR